MEVKTADSVLNFKVKLEEFKQKCISNSVRNYCYFWEVSDEVLSKIEGTNYIENKDKHIQFLMLNPHVAKKQFVNLG